MRRQKRNMVLKLILEIVLVAILSVFIIVNWNNKSDDSSSETDTISKVTTTNKETSSILNQDKETTNQILEEATTEFVTQEQTTEKKVEETTTKIEEETTDDSKDLEAYYGTGVLLSEGEINYIKYAIENKVSPNYETWQTLLTSPLSNPTWNPRAVETVIRGGNGDNVSKLYIDVARAYQCALIWRINGSVEHGACAVRILNAYANILKCVTGNADRYLAAGLFGYQLANTAYLVKEHPDFNNEAMKTMLKDVFYYPLNERFLTGNEWGRDHNDAYISNYFANWDLCNMASAMAIGIYCEEVEIYNKAVTYFKSGLGNGSIYNAIPYVHPDGTAQWQESGRDQGHTLLGIGLMACVCEMAWNQGDDLYGMADNRLLKAAEYAAKYNLGEEVLFSEYEWGSGTKGDVKYATVVSGAGRGEVRPIWSMIYNHYVGRRGLETKYVKKMLDSLGYEYGAVSGGHATTYDQPGWGTLTYANNNEWDEKYIKKDVGNIVEGIYSITSLHSNKSLTVSADNRVTQKNNENTEDIKWQFVYLGGGEYKIVNVKTNLAMTVENATHANGGLLVAKEYTGAINQKFAILNNGDGTYRIIASISSKAVDLKDWSNIDGSDIIQWRYINGTNQKWFLN